MGGAHHCSGPPVSEMTYTVSSGTLNPSIPRHAQTVDHIWAWKGGQPQSGVSTSACVGTARQLEV